MPAPLRVVLNEESERTLQELRVAAHVVQQIKDRAHMVRLNAQGWNVPAIAEIFECREQTVRLTLRRWEQGGLGGLWDTPGRGAKPKWQEEDIKYLEACLDTDAPHLQQCSTGSAFSTRAASRTECRPNPADSAKKGFRWKRTRHSQQRQQDPEQQRLKKADLETLKLAAPEGHIKLKYLDESGFCLFSPVSYRNASCQTTETLGTGVYSRQPHQHFGAMATGATV